MSLNVRLLEQSFATIAPRGDELAETFFRNLFSDYPDVQPLFAETSAADRREQLASTLARCVTNLRRPDVLVPMLEQIGAENATLGATEAHYPAVGASLLKSLAEVSGDDWTGEMAVAWSEALGEIAHHMLNGATQPAS